MIGMFNIDTISEHESMFLKGKLATWSPSQKHTEFQIEEKDCSKPLDMGSSEDSGMDDDILAEILAEEAERAKLEDQDTKRKNVMGSKKKKKKGKKSKKDEL